jgi:Mg2+-importing ATPase
MDDGATGLGEIRLLRNPGLSAHARDPRVGTCWWSRDPGDLIAALNATIGGLSTDEAARRLAVYGPNHPRPPHRHATVRLLLGQLRSPIALLLLITATVSAFLGDRTNALIIIGILIGSSGLGFWQEYGAARAMEELLRLIRTRARVRRDGREQEIPVESTRR